MHAFVPAVLLRVTGFDALDADPEPQPPHGELTQAEEGGAAGEGDAVVGADRQRQPKVFKNPFKHGKCVHLLGCAQGLAAQQIAARRVGDGQRVAVPFIGEHELALVIGAPQIVRMDRV